MFRPIPLTITAVLPRKFLFSTVALNLAYLICAPGIQAALPPPAPDGGYPGANTAEGQFALFNLTTGGDNTAAGFSALVSNTTGSFNTAIGVQALYLNTGDANTAIGFDALLSNTTGFQNTATGYEALFSNTTGSFNTASGLNALASNTTGTANTANGSFALIENTIGNNNTASGDGALFNNTSGDNNTATGVDALLSNTTGANNTASGTSALQSNTIGSNNTATGISALVNNTTGSSNIAIGNSAGLNLTTGKNNIDIGAPGVAAEANTIRIGKSGTQKKTFIAGIRGVTVASGVGVIVGSSGQLGTVVSSARFKEAIKPMDRASEAILSLKPVTFRYKEELDQDRAPQFGLIAQEVEKVNPDLVVRDDDGKISTVRYEAVNAMLLNEFLKEHRTVQEQGRIVQQQEARLAKQEATIAKQQKQIEALTTGLQKVSDRVVLRKPSRKLVVTNH